MVGIERHIGAEGMRCVQARGHSIYGDDECGAAQSCPERRAQANRALGKDRDRVADPDVAAFRTGQSGRKNVWTHEHGFIVEIARDRREIRARVRHEQVLGPCAIDRIAKAPASQRPAALRVRAVQAIKALAAWRDRADDDTLSDSVMCVQTRTKLLDDADRLVAEHEPWFHGILAAHDVYVRATDCRRSDLDDCLASTRHRLCHFFNTDLPLATKHHGPHRRHDYPFPCTAGWTILTLTGMPRRTLSVTMQKSSNRRSHRSSRGRSLSGTSG